MGAFIQNNIYLELEGVQDKTKKEIVKTILEGREYTLYTVIVIILEYDINC